MTNRKSTWILVGVGLLLLALPWPNLMAGTALPPRTNPEFRNLLSGVVAVDPTMVNVPGTGADPVLVGDRPHSAILAIPTGTNVLCNQDATTEHQNEPSIAVNPQDPDHVIASSNDYRLKATGGDVHPGYYVSFDGGQTWVGDGVIDLSPIPGVEAGGDPAMAIYDLNNVYFAYIAFHRTVDDVGGVFVSKSTDGGLTWQDPVGVAANTASIFHDKEYITVDTSGSAYDGNVYVSWTRFEFNSPIYFARSTDGGATFSTPMEISDPSYNSNQGSIPNVGPNGEVYVAWYNYTTGGHRIAISQDGGQTFSNRYPIASVNTIPSPLPGASFRNNSFPTFTTDKNNGNLYVAWNDYSSGDADILFVRSTDGGQNWSAPIRVNDDPYGNDLHQFFPWLSVAPNGDVYAGWFDSRHDPTPYAEPFIYDEYVAMSTDGGLTFGPNVRISEVSPDASIGFNGSFIGDYSGIAATNDFVFPAWVDTRRGHQDIFTQIHPRSNTSAKHAPAVVERGQVFTYTIVLSNANQVDDTYLADPLPTEVAFVPGSLWASGGSYGQSAGVVTWTGSLSAGLALTITFQVTPTAACSVNGINSSNYSSLT